MIHRHTAAKERNVSQRMTSNQRIRSTIQSSKRILRWGCHSILLGAPCLATVGCHLPANRFSVPFAKTTQSSDEAAGPSWAAATAGSGQTVPGLSQIRSNAPIAVETPSRAAMTDHQSAPELQVTTDGLPPIVTPSTVTPNAVSPDAVAPGTMSTPRATDQQVTSDQHSPAMTAASSGSVTQASFTESTEGQEAVGNTSQTKQAVWTQPTNSVIDSAQTADVKPAVASETTGVAPVIPASALETNYCGETGCQTCSDGSSCGTGACEAPAGMPIQNVQEYIFDGGDTQPTVVIQNDWTAEGLNPTDTVIYYETLGGKVCVKPSNRVPIYAPRFGAVRQVTGAILTSRAVGTERILAPVAANRMADVNLTGAVVQPLAPLGEQQVNLIDAFQENAAGKPIEQVIPPQRMSEAVIPHEAVDVLATGRITDEEVIVLGRFIQNAHAWYVPESLSVLVEEKKVAHIVDVDVAQEVYVYEMPDKCAMRICKTASHSIADPGDTVRFTIRFDNSGVKPLGNAVIMDSLSPRLEYIEGSQQSSVEVRFSTEPNEVGSQVLRWEIVSPIEASEGGAISFDCRVR